MPHLIRVMFIHTWSLVSNVILFLLFDLLANGWFCTGMCFCFELLLPWFGLNDWVRLNRMVK